MAQAFCRQHKRSPLPGSNKNACARGVGCAVADSALPCAAALHVGVVRAYAREQNQFVFLPFLLLPLNIRGEEEGWGTGRNGRNRRDRKDRD